MRYRFLFGLAVLFVLWTPAPGHATACEQPLTLCTAISDVADAWADVAHTLEKNADDLDLPQLEKEIQSLLDPSMLLGEALIGLGNDDEMEQGEQLLEILDELYDVQGDDLAAYLADHIDDIAEVMDFIVAYCKDAGV